MTVRPTLRCLREDLHRPIPPGTVPLNELDHPLLNKARQKFSDPAIPRERIRAIDDLALFKVKVSRWRGAVHYHRPAADVSAWLVRAGIREEGSNNDFYAALHQECRTARQRYNESHDKPITSDTYSQHLLPNITDHKRYQLEEATRFSRDLSTTVNDLVIGSLRDGHEHAVQLTGFRVGVQVRADHSHETYVAIHITGSVPHDLTRLILSRVPGCAPDGWFPESSLPLRKLMPAEQVWSNLMDPKRVAMLLEG